MVKTGRSERHVVGHNEFSSLLRYGLGSPSPKESFLLVSYEGTRRLQHLSNTSGSESYVAAKYGERTSRGWATGHMLFNFMTQSPFLRWPVPAL